MKRPLSRFVIILSVCFSVPANAASDTCMTRAQQAIDAGQLQQAEQILQSHLQQHGDDDAASFLLARVRAWQQDYTPSLEIFNRLLDAHPDNSDYLLARARLHEWMGNDELALQDLRHARERSPDYLEIWQQELRLLSRKIQAGHNPDTYNTLLQQAQQRFPQQDWRQQNNQPALPQADSGQYHIAARAGRDNLSNNRAAWKQASVVLSGRTDNGSAHMQVDSYERFSLRDWQLAGGASMPLSPHWGITFNGSISPTARVIARNRVEAIINKSLSNGFNVHVGVQYANFATTDSQQLHVTGEYYRSHYRFAYTYRLIDVDNAGTGHNQRAVVSANYGATSTISFALANGKDVEYDGTSSPPVSRVSTVSLYGRHAIQSDTSLTWSFIHHKQGNFYNRNGFVLGAQFDF